MASEIFLIRHGETIWNAEGRFQGASNSPLTARGRSQAEDMGRALGQLLHHGTKVSLHVSPLGRARETAELAAPHMGTLLATSIEPRLREVSIGSWDGLTHIDIEAVWPGWLDGSTPFDWFFRSPDGESYDAAAERVRDWLSSIEGIVVAISHGLTGRIVRGVYLGLSKDEALGLPVPQDIIWHLVDHKIEAIAANMDAALQ